MSKLFVNQRQLRGIARAARISETCTYHNRDHGDSAQITAAAAAVAAAAAAAALSATTEISSEQEEDRCWNRRGAATGLRGGSTSGGGRRGCDWWGGILRRGSSRRWSTVSDARHHGHTESDRTRTRTTTSADRSRRNSPERAFTAHAVVLVLVVRNRVRSAIHRASRSERTYSGGRIDNRQPRCVGPHMNGCFVGYCARAIVIVVVDSRRLRLRATRRRGMQLAFAWVPFIRDQRGWFTVTDRDKASSVGADRTGIYRMCVRNWLERYGALSSILCVNCNINVFFLDIFCLIPHTKYT